MSHNCGEHPHDCERCTGLLNKSILTKEYSYDTGLVQQENKFYSGK